MLTRFFQRILHTNAEVPRIAASVPAASSILLTVEQLQAHALKVTDSLTTMDFVPLMPTSQMPISVVYQRLPLLVQTEITLPAFRKMVRRNPIFFETTLDDTVSLHRAVGSVPGFGSADTLFLEDGLAWCNQVEMLAKYVPRAFTPLSLVAAQSPAAITSLIADYKGAVVELSTCGKRVRLVPDFQHALCGTADALFASIPGDEVNRRLNVLVECVPTFFVHWETIAAIVQERGALRRTTAATCEELLYHSATSFAVCVEGEFLKLSEYLNHKHSGTADSRYTTEQRDRYTLSIPPAAHSRSATLFPCARVGQDATSSSTSSSPASSPLHTSHPSTVFPLRDMTTVTELPKEVLLSGAKEVMGLYAGYGWVCVTVGTTNFVMSRDATLPAAWKALLQDPSVVKYTFEPEQVQRVLRETMSCEVAALVDVADVLLHIGFPVWNDRGLRPDLVKKHVMGGADKEEWDSSSITPSITYRPPLHHHPTQAHFQRLAVCSRSETGLLVWNSLSAARWTTPTTLVACRSDHPMLPVQKMSRAALWKRNLTLRLARMGWDPTTTHRKTTLVDQLPPSKLLKLLVSAQFANGTVERSPLMRMTLSNPSQARTPQEERSLLRDGSVISAAAPCTAVHTMVAPVNEEEGKVTKSPLPQVMDDFDPSDMLSSTPIPTALPASACDVEKGTLQHPNGMKKKGFEHLCNQAPSDPETRSPTTNSMTEMTEVMDSFDPFSAADTADTAESATAGISVGAMADDSSPRGSSWSTTAGGAPTTTTTGMMDAMDSFDPFGDTAAETGTSPSVVDRSPSLPSSFHEKEFSPATTTTTTTTTTGMMDAMDSFDPFGAAAAAEETRNHCFTPPPAAHPAAVGATNRANDAADTRPAQRDVAPPSKRHYQQQNRSPATVVASGFAQPQLLHVPPLSRENLESELRLPPSTKPRARYNTVPKTNNNTKPNNKKASAAGEWSVAVIPEEVRRRIAEEWIRSQLLPSAATGTTAPFD